MQILNESGEFEAAAYDESILGFEHEDYGIRQPFLSECGRFFVDPVKAYGFEVISTGGGCMALSKTLPDGSRIVLTGEDGCSLPELTDWANNIIGRFDASNQQVAWINAGDVPSSMDE